MTDGGNEARLRLVNDKRMRIDRFKGILLKKKYSRISFWFQVQKGSEAAV